jgi:hypothetical protein
MNDNNLRSKQFNKMFLSIDIICLKCYSVVWYKKGNGMYKSTTYKEKKVKGYFAFAPNVVSAVNHL